MFSVLAAPLIYGLERWQGTPTLLEYNLEFIERCFKGKSKPLIWSKPLMRNTLTHVLSSAAGTMMVGTTAGAAMGIWIVKRTNARLQEIQQCLNAQKQGNFTPKPINWLHQLGLAEQPVTDPQKAYQELMNVELNRDKAFSKWASLIAMLKLVPLILTTLVSWLVLLALPKTTNSVLVKQLETSLKSSVHFAMIAKLMALPVIGGLIARDIVPWIKKQIQSQPQSQATPQPGV